MSRSPRLSDFEPGPLQIAIGDKDRVVREALKIAEQGFTSLSLRVGSLRGKPVYQQTSLAQVLLVRHVNDNVRKITSVKQADRKSIIKCLAALFSEGINFQVLRLDIKSFYESVDTHELVMELERDAAFSRQSITLLRTFFSALQARGLTGLPRGIGLSATLSEYMLRKFDMTVRTYPGVTFYSRYVDDILVVFSGRSDGEKLVEHCQLNLPSGLTFNRKKSQRVEFSQTFSGVTPPMTEHIIEFLGYQFDVSRLYRSGGSIRRDVNIDISTNKVNKIKRKVALSIIAFNDGGSFNDLHQRIKFLTSNYPFTDAVTAEVRFGGLRFAYPLIDPISSKALKSLDYFIYNALYSNNPKNRLKPKLSRVQRGILAGYSFKTGYVETRFFSYNGQDMRKITGCWAHA